MEDTEPESPRSKNDIQEVLQLASIKESDLTQVTQILYSMVEPEENSNYKLLELDSHLLESLKIGDTISFRGNKDDPAVIVSGSRTYELKEAETSNSFLLVDSLKHAKETKIQGVEERIIEEKKIKGIFHKYLEVRECMPKLSTLPLLLGPSSFKGLEYEQSIDPATLYTWDRLCREVQASDGELKKALPEYLITCIDGYYRLIAFEFEARALPLMLDFIEENTWPPDEVEKESTYDALKEIIPRPIFDLLFQKYAEPSGKHKKDGTPLYRYFEEKSSKLLAQVLLSACPVNDYTAFMQAWNIGSPDCIRPKEKYLYGIAIVVWNSQNMRKEVLLFPESNLADNINRRFQELFKVKDKWTAEEITPYISKFATQKQNVNALLTKYTRSSTVNGTKYYSSKHGK